VKRKGYTERRGTEVQPVVYRKGGLTEGKGRGKAL